MARSLRVPLSAGSVTRTLSPYIHPQSTRHFSQLLSSTSRSSRTSSAVTPFHITVLSTRTLFTRKQPRPFRKAVIWTLLAFGATFGVAYHLDSRSAIHRWIAIPVLQAVTDPETAQKLAVRLLSLGIMPRDMVEDDAILATEVSGAVLCERLRSSYSPSECTTGGWP
jgi:dihydroorotate dehydrogenase